MSSDDDFKGIHHSMQRSMLKLVVITILGNIVFWGGLIYLVFWCLRHFGVI